MTCLSMICSNLYVMRVQQPHHFKPFEFCATVHFNGTPHKMVLFSFTKNNVSRLQRTMLVGQLQEIMGQDRIVQNQLSLLVDNL